MQDHWLRVGPPAYILHAMELGYKGTDSGENSDDFVEDPDELAALLANIPGGSFA
jgi:hypothetical protein